MAGDRGSVGGVGEGAGELSAAARARLARAAGTSSPEPPPPPLDDLVAVAHWRAAMHATWGEEVQTGEAAHEEAWVAGVRCLVAGPPGGPTVMYLHGGGYVLGSPGVAVPITARLAGAGLRVVSVDYRLAPEHPFPAALDDALAVYGALAAATATGTGLRVAGDSAGGAIALGVALRAGQAVAAPTALALLCPHLDHRERGEAGELTAAYRGTTSPEDPLLSPAGATLASLGELPPVLVQSTPGDALFGQAVSFARRARIAGGDVTLDVWWGLWHTWHYHRELPEADRALGEVAAFLTGHSRPH